MDGHFMETRPPLVPYYPELMQDTYESILAQYLKVPDFKIPPYPGIRFNVKDNMLEIEMHIQRSQVHPTNKALWEYIYEHYPKAPFRISLWDWRRDESVSPDPTLLHPEITMSDQEFENFSLVLDFLWHLSSLLL